MDESKELAWEIAGEKLLREWLAEWDVSDNPRLRARAFEIRQENIERELGEVL